MSAQNTMTKRGCGCGGNGSPGVSALAVGGGCSCGAADCAQCQDQSYRRPVFFAGQLLTEDDLDAMSDYVVQKNRLHNRALFGPGVVCGLDVACNPCGGGKVTVHPGYALDCCGNDIVVSCPKELDILKMIRGLRTAARGGTDCGDPCAQQPPVVKDATTAPDRFTYCLYVRYAETATDLVSPFATDDACTNTSCQPTRMLEGWQFELRCKPAVATPDDLFARVVRCFGDIVKTEKSAGDSLVMTKTAESIKSANAAIAKAYVVDQTVLDRATAAALRLASLVADQGSVEGAKGAASAGAAKLTKDWTRADVDALLEDAAVLGQLYAGLFFANPNDRRLIQQALQKGGVQDLSGVLSGARTAFDSDPKAAQLLDSALAVAQARAVLRVSAEAANLSSEGFSPTSQGYYTYQLMSEGAVYDAELHGAYRVALSELRQALLICAEAPSGGDCDAATEVAAVAVPAPTQELMEADARSMVTTVDRLSVLLLRRVFECVCAAINPPCAPCDDPSVLLACLVVENCEVTEICNLARTFVLSSTAMRYWVPPLTWLGAVLESACCGGGESVLRGGKLVLDRRVPDFSGIDPRRILESARLLTAPASAVQASLALEYAGAAPNLPRIARVSEMLSQIAMIRAGAPLDMLQMQSSAAAVELARNLAIEPARSQLGTMVDGRVADAVKRGTIDVGPSIREAAAANLAAMRADQAALLKNGLRDFATSSAQDGLGATVGPLVDARLAGALGNVDAKISDQVGHAMVTAGLDNPTMTGRIRNEVASSLSSAGLDTGSFNSRVSGLVSSSLTSEGLGSSALKARTSDAVRQELDARGLTASAVPALIDSHIGTALAAAGLSPADSLNARIDNRVSGSLSAVGLSAGSIEPRIDSRFNTLLSTPTFAGAVDDRVRASGASVADVTAAQTAMAKMMAALTERLTAAESANRDLVTKLGSVTKRVTALEKKPNG